MAAAGLRDREAMLREEPSLGSSWMAAGLLRFSKRPHTAYSLEAFTPSKAWHPRVLRGDELSGQAWSGIQNAATDHGGPGWVRRLKPRMCSDRTSCRMIISMRNCSVIAAQLLPVAILCLAVTACWVTPAQAWQSAQTGSESTAGDAQHGSAVQQPDPPRSTEGEGSATNGSAVPADPAAERIRDLQAKVKQQQTALEGAPADSPDQETLKTLLAEVAIDLAAAETLRSQKQAWVTRYQKAPTTYQSLREQKASKSPRDNRQEAVAEIANLSFEEAQARLQAMKTQLATETKDANALSAEVDARSTRLAGLLQAISQARSELESTTTASPGQAGDEPLERARRWAWEAKRLRAEQKLRSLENEQLAYEAEAQLLPLSLELAQDRVKQLQAVVDEVTEVLEDQRRTRINEFRIAFLRSNPPSEPAYDKLRTFLAINAPATTKPSEPGAVPSEMEITWRILSERADRVRRQVEQVQADLDYWSAALTKMKQRVNPQSGGEGVARSNRWVVERLRKQRQELPDPRAQTERLRAYQSQIEIAQSMEYDLDEVTRQIQADPEADPDEEGSPAQIGLSVAKSMEADVDEYLNGLYLAADLSEELRLLSVEYRSFIDKSLLWTPSASRMHFGALAQAGEALRWLLNFDNWQLVGELYVRDARRNAFLYVAFGVGWLVLLYNQARMRRLLGQLSDKARRNTCTDFSLSARGLVLTLVIAAPAALLLAFLAWRLDAACRYELTSEGFPRAIAAALWLAVQALLPMELLRQVCRRDGLATHHFGWREQTSRLLKNNLRWLINLSLPLVIVIGVFSVVTEPAWGQSLGRLSFMILMPLLSVFLGQVFHPRRGIFADWLSKNNGGWLDQLSYLWFPAILLAPLSLGVLSYLGYEYTAEQFALRVGNTVWMIVFMTVLYCLLKRWLLLNRRQLMVAQAKQRLQEAALRERNELPLPTSRAQLGSADLAAISQQTKRLLTSLFVTVALVLAYWIWSDIVPAISILNEVVLWELEDGAAITLESLVLVLPIIVLVTIAARNVPGLLEIALLQHLPLSNPARYAISSLARYALVALGIVLTASTLGLRWSSIQWLVAGLGVGLGFGLQEILANFVCGVILLFEQPIRVGDIVTIDGTTGTVAQIRMRATTIVNWDRQELIVPNKEFITTKLINWTLTDTTNRVVVNVGIAYGSDAERACQIVQQVCTEHSEIMTEPPPVVTFEGFGDNTLNLVVRAYLASLEHRLSTIHELHQQIYAALNAAHIEIAFPQRDLHVRSLPESLARWLNQRGAAAQGQESVTSYSD